ncbi:S41 family peptidase [Deinococcus puniceus]|uniref:Peptidase S41 n=1 Tax=Deinococcus puniceus TaxID=1182568 RepID=A0A172T9K2_9DEIO|nr:S41 family peptidase [Deinococcus puniceus]ANE43690.1 peptidase S41 [Deinococcus puniceus]
MPQLRCVPALLLALTCGLAAASPATDLFDTVTKAVQTGYYGWSTVDRVALAQKYAPILAERCEAQAESCDYGTGRAVITDMLKELGDAHTNVRDAEAAERLAEVSQNKSVPRTGARVSRVAGGLLVVSVMPGSPAERAGVRRFDLLTQVNGEQAGTDQPIGPNEFVRLERANSPMSVSVKRAGTPERTVTLTPQNLQARDEPTLSWVGEGGRTALIQYPTFLSSDSAELFLERVGEAKRANAEALIVDLRYNGGGSLNECVAASSVFGPTIYRARFERGGFTYGGLLGDEVMSPVARMARPDWAVWKQPVAVLIGPNTASCAEVFTHYARLSGATAIGEVTRGVGNSGVNFRPLPDGGVLGLTILKAFDAADKPLPDRITPDILAPTDIAALTSTGQDTTLDAALTVLKAQVTKREAPRTEPPAPPKQGLHGN